MTLSEELRRLRALKGVTLRKVEEETKISNAYLSQLENGKTDQPSPHILHKLANFYDVAYTHLLKEAGYLERKEDESHRKVSDIQSALMSANLTEEEEELVVKLIERLRGRDSS